MNIIIPMAGLGKRMRPHTLTTPKPLIRLAGKPIVEHLIEEIALSIKEPIDEIAFVTGHFGEQSERDLCAAAKRIGARGGIFYQEEALGTAHAILCAADALHGPVIVAFADTLFFCQNKLNTDKDSIIWTMKVEDPRAFGVVLTEADHRITGFMEKPQEPVSDQAIIGIYFFKDGENLRKELQYLVDHNVRKGNEYQLTDALQNMLEKGIRFYSEPVDEWLDCGNKNATIGTHARVLAHKGHQVSPKADIRNSVVIPPCYIAGDVHVENAVVGPFVSLDTGSMVKDAVLTNTIVQQKAKVENIVLHDSMIGNQAEAIARASSVNLGDYSASEC